MQEKYTSKLFVTKKNDKFLKIMKIYFFITFLCIFSVTAENIYSQSKAISAAATICFSLWMIPKAVYQRL